MANDPDKEFAQHLDQIRADISALSDTVGKLVSDTAGIRASLRRKAGSVARQAAETGGEMLSEAAGMGQDALDAAAHSASDAAHRVEAQITRNPFPAVLIALGVGFVVGLLSRR